MRMWLLYLIRLELGHLWILRSNQQCPTNSNLRHFNVSLNGDLEFSKLSSRGCKNKCHAQRIFLLVVEATYHERQHTENNKTCIRSGESSARIRCLLRRHESTLLLIEPKTTRLQRQ